MDAVEEEDEDDMEGDVRELGSDEGHNSPFGNEFEHIHRNQLI